MSFAFLDLTGCAIHHSSLDVCTRSPHCPRPCAYLAFAAWLLSSSLDPLSALSLHESDTIDNGSARRSGNQVEIAYDAYDERRDTAPRLVEIFFSLSTANLACPILARLVQHRLALHLSLRRFYRPFGGLVSRDVAMESPYDALGYAGCGVQRSRRTNERVRGPLLGRLAEIPEFESSPSESGSD
ncbi:hypothetical protein B0H14DRAFT_3505366 [Mycena olivaceomarginata]|nr:hypothetical protein B0H14DRAFT_3505366 [Mycena olivaceomarginata]